MVQRIIWINRVEKGRSDNWLKLYAYSAQSDINKEYSLDYCGTELHLNDLPMSDEYYEVLKEALQKDFGYGPYNIYEIRRIIGNGMSIDLS